MSYARDLACDEDEARDERVRKLVKDQPAETPA
jgi:hypothetical protein